VIRSSPYTAQEVADATGVCMTRATKKVDRIEDLLRRLLSRPGVFAASRRPDRVARAVADFLLAAGPLAQSDPERFRQWLLELLRENGSSGSRP